MRLSKEIPNSNLRIGDRIIGRSGKDHAVTSMEIARGCGNIHIVTTQTKMVQCYDRAGFVTVLA